MKMIDKFTGHFRTINRHKFMVMAGCFRLGLFRQGLMHDLSKYSPVEFIAGVRYYQGDRSPIAAEKEARGYSAGWLHHKGRNRHHIEYWIDMLKPQDGMVGMRIPLRYVAESFVDRVCACKVYKKEAYTDRDAWDFYSLTRDYVILHPETRRFLEKLLKMLAVKGEKATFRYLRYMIWVKKDY